MLHRTCIALAAVVLAGGLAVAAPADAGPMGQDAVRIAVPNAAEFAALAEGALPPGIRSLAQEAVDLGTAAETPAPGRRATLSVNMAILLLGSLWLTLMVRRIQVRLAAEGLNGGARPHAAGGH